MASSSMAVLKPAAHGSAPVATQQSTILVGSVCTGAVSEGLALKCADGPAKPEFAPDCNVHDRPTFNALHHCKNVYTDTPR